MKLTSITLRVADLPKARQFYEQTLGLKLKFGFPGLATFEAGYLTIGLQQHGVAAAGMKIPATVGVLAETELVLEVPDIHGSVRSLTSRGVVFESEPKAIAGDPSRRLMAAAFKDPDGHRLVLTGWVAP